MLAVAYVEVTKPFHSGGVRCDNPCLLPPNALISAHIGDLRMPFSYLAPPSSTAPKLRLRHRSSIDLPFVKRLTFGSLRCIAAR